MLSAMALTLSNTIFVIGKKWKDSITREDRSLSYNQHFKIYEAIKEKNPAKAGKAMSEHLKEMEKIWKKAGV